MIIWKWNFMMKVITHKIKTLISKSYIIQQHTIMKI